MEDSPSRTETKPVKKDEFFGNTWPLNLALNLAMTAQLVVVGFGATVKSEIVKVPVNEGFPVELKSSSAEVLLSSDPLPPQEASMKSASAEIKERRRGVNIGKWKITRTATGVLQRRLTFDLSGLPKAGPLEGRVRRRCCRLRDAAKCGHELQVRDSGSGN